jgi:Na+-transporting NADH:ubiquinone oxidoreductase subunit C
VPDEQPKSAAKAFSRDSVSNTLLVSVSLSLVCSILVAATAVSLKPIQEQNEEEYRQRIILDVAGLMKPDADVGQLFESIDTRMVELETGAYVDDPDPGQFDAIIAANDPDSSVAIPPDQDLAGIRRRARYAPVYLVREEGEVEQVILPVYGKGLWSTMLGYLALATDGDTVRGLRFYSHAETPGLGDKIDDAGWRELWVGKKVFDPDGMPGIEVIKGPVPAGNAPGTEFQIDGISGATLTGRGVSNLVRYWTGPHGFGPYLKQIDNSDDAR